MIVARLSPPLRRLIRIGLLLPHLVWGMGLAGAVFPFASVAQRDRIISRWSGRLLRILGVRLRVTSAPVQPGGGLLVCNHVSWLDIHLIHAARRVHFVSKAEVRKWPVAGWLAHKSGTLFLERSRRADTARVNAEMRDLMRNGAMVAVFPEGTTSDGRGLRRFLPSLLQPAVELGCPTVPAALRYQTLDGRPTEAAAYINDISLWHSLLQIVSAPGLVAELQFGEPIQPNGHRRELAAQAEAATAALLGVASPSATGLPRSDGAIKPEPAAAPAGTTPQTPADRTV